MPARPRPFIMSLLVISFSMTYPPMVNKFVNKSNHFLGRLPDYISSLDFLFKTERLTAKSKKKEEP
jgi:hypothetical protein